MKILYLSDSYGKHNEGTKHSIFHEVQRRGHSVVWQTVHSAGGGRVDGASLVKNVRAGGFDWVWVAHSWTTFVGCTKQDIHDAGARVLGFGFSDPYNWNPTKLDQYDAYATNCFAIHDRIRAAGTLPVNTIITAGDSGFHRNLGIGRDIDVIIYGSGLHPRFTPRDYRIRMVHELRALLPHRMIAVYGPNWGDVPSRGVIQGDRFLQVVNRARVSADLQQPHAPLAHRMFECMMCGTPVVTRATPETQRLFGDWDGLSYYEDARDLADKVEQVLDRADWAALSERVRAYSLQHHDIGSRVGPLLSWVEGL